MRTVHSFLLIVALSSSASLAAEESVKWSSTTVESASAPENKQVLDQGKPATVTGEVVDVSCYLQLGKRGPGHKDCGRKCVKNGAPVGIVDKDGRLTILMAEQHHPRRDGKVGLAKWGAEKMAETVTVTGMLQVKDGTQALYIEAPEEK